eukprot:COSAG02_NODE_93_length_37477_cov_78.101129_23_plen_45_part_00
MAPTLRIGMHATVDSSVGASARIVGELALSRRNSSSLGCGPEKI